MAQHAPRPAHAAATAPRRGALADPVGADPARRTTPTRCCSTSGRTTRRRTACCGWSRRSTARPWSACTTSSATCTRASRRTWSRSRTGRRSRTRPGPTTTRSSRNELVYCMAVEKLLGLEVPRRARVDPRDLQRAAAPAQPPDLPRHRLDRPRRHRAALLLLPRARPRARPLRARRRRAHARALRPGRRRRRGRPGGLRPRGARRHQGAARARRRVRGPDRAAADLPRPHQGHRRDHAGVRAPDGPHGPERARLGRGLGPARARALRRLPRDPGAADPAPATATSTTAT